MSKCGQPLKYDTPLCKGVYVQFTEAQFDLLIDSLSTTETASQYLRQLFLDALSSNSRLIKPTSTLNNGSDGS